MYKKINYITTALILLCSVAGKAQITTESPYSVYGLGNFRGALLPQYRAMGGISTAVNKPTVYSNINMQNPASYAGITLTTLDVGMTGGFTTVKQGGMSNKDFNSSFNHLAFAFPVVTGKSALSAGIMPYTQLGYQYSVSETLDTLQENRRYSGEGGLTKAYIGFGQQFGDHFRIGANIEYLFGNLRRNRATELQAYPVINAKMQNNNSIGGLAYSYGLQYDIPLNSKSSITLGYSGSSSSSLNSKTSYVLTQYKTDANGDEASAFDTLEHVESPRAKLKLPLMHNFGIAFQKSNNWLFGADYRMGKWSDLSIGGVNQGLQDSWGFSAGGQYIPDFGAISGYFNHVEYRLGYTYDQTFIRVNGQDIRQRAVTFGVGLPLASSRYSIYKLNLTAEVGKRGPSGAGGLQENYVNLHLNFTLNDTWFKRFKFD